MSPESWSAYTAAWWDGFRWGLMGGLALGLAIVMVGALIVGGRK